MQSNGVVFSVESDRENPLAQESGRNSHSKILKKFPNVVPLLGNKRTNFCNLTSIILRLKKSQTDCQNGDGFSVAGIK